MFADSASKQKQVQEVIVVFEGLVCFCSAEACCLLCEAGY